MSWIEAGQFLAEWRDLRGISQDGLHFTANVSISSISRIENGKGGEIEDKTINRVARALGTEHGAEFLQLAGRDDLAAKLRSLPDQSVDLPYLLKKAKELSDADQAELVRDLLEHMRKR